MIRAHVSKIATMDNDDLSCPFAQLLKYYTPVYMLRSKNTSLAQACPPEDFGEKSRISSYVRTTLCEAYITF